MRQSPRGAPEGEVLGDFKVNYLGSVSVEQPRGEDVIANAAQRAKQTSQDAVKVSLVVTSGSIKVVDRDSNDVLQNSPIKNVTFCGVDPQDKKQLIYITKAPKGNLFYGHVFQVKEKASEIARTIVKAFPSDASQYSAPSGIQEEDSAASPAPPRAATAAAAAAAAAPASTPPSQSSLVGPPPSTPAPFPLASSIAPALRASVNARPGSASSGAPHASGSLSSPLVAAQAASSAQASPAVSSAPTSTPSASAAAPDPSMLDMADLPKFDAVYLGSTLLTVPRGMDVLQRAVEENREMLAAAQAARRRQGRRGADGESVTIVVHPEGLHVFEVGSGDQKFSHFIKNITFSGIVGDHFAYIVLDERTNRIDCFIFSTLPGVGAHLCMALKDAMTRNEREEQQRGQNPFAVTDPRREPVRGELYRRQIHRVDLQSVKAIGAGQFGEVYLARQAIKAGEHLHHVDRAVKLLRSSATPADKNNFLREAEVMLLLQHRNLVELVGVAVQQRPWLMVVEYMRYGDLRSVLRTLVEKGVSLHAAEQIDWCMQIAAGMNHITRQRLVHMDLAARNCLLGANNLVKISDFGLTRPMEAGKDHLVLRETLRLPIKWLALECVTEKIFGEPSDVWAFGVTAWEVFRCDFARTFLCVCVCLGGGGGWVGVGGCLGGWVGGCLGGWVGVLLVCTFSSFDSRFD